MPFDFLGTEEVQIPTGGGFAPTGLVSLWNAGVVFSVLAQIDPIVVAEMGVEYDSKRDSRSGSGWTTYYWRDFARAQADIAAMDIRNQQGRVQSPTSVWQFETKTADVLNFNTPEAAGKFGDIISYSVEIHTLQSRKKRHMFHQIALPACVAAGAVAEGYTTPGFSLDELLDPSTLFTDDFAVKAYGGPEGEGWQDSFLWQRRVALWAALGEDNATAYLPIGHMAGGKSAAKYVTKAPKLSECLKLATMRWTKPAYANVLQVPDPRVDAVSGSGDRRLTVAAIVALYGNKAAAQAAAEAMKTTGDETETPTTTATAATPAVHTTANVPVTVTYAYNVPQANVPQAWRGFEADWKVAVAAAKVALGTVPAGPPPAIAAYKAKVAAYANTNGLSATPDEVIAWMNVG